MHATITSAAQILRGWGMSLSWEANVIYGSCSVTAQTPNPLQQARYMDLLYGNLEQRLRVCSHLNSIQIMDLIQSSEAAIATPAA